MTAAADVQPLRSLVLLADRTSPIEMNGLVLGPDGVLVLQNPAPAFQFRFHYEYRNYRVDVTPSEDGFKCRVMVFIGHIPFSVENPCDRTSLLELTRLSRDDRMVRCLTGTQQSFWIAGETVSDERPTPSAVLFETARLVVAFRPVMVLAAPYLLRKDTPVRTIAPGSTRTH